MLNAVRLPFFEQERGPIGLRGRHFHSTSHGNTRLRVAYSLHHLRLTVDPTDHQPRA